MCPANRTFRWWRRLGPLVVCATLACTASANQKAEDEPLSMQALGTPIQAEAGAVTAKLQPQYEYTRLESDTYVHMLLSLEGSEDAAVERPTLDLALVVDRSGSMSGAKLDDVKTASLEILDELAGNDRVTLISYASDVQRHVTGEAGQGGRWKDTRRALFALEAGGGTALGPALFSALDRAGASGEQGPAIGSLPHVILLSDGQANEGEQDPGVLGRRAAVGFGRGMSVSTIGVGVDYNEDLMTKLADEGGGRYHYVRNSEEIERVLSDEMAGLVQTVASEVGLVALPSRGVTLEEVYGYPSERKGAKTLTRVGSVGKGQERQILLRYKLPAERDLPVGEFGLGKLQVNFKAAATKDKPAEIKTITLEPVIHLTKDADQAAKSENYTVSVRLAEIEAAASMDQVTSAIDAGDLQRAEELLQSAQSSTAVKKAAAVDDEMKEAYGEQVEEFEQARQSMEAAKQSESERKAFSKGYKSSAYKKRKGSKKVYKKSKKPKKKGK